MLPGFLPRTAVSRRTFLAGAAAAVVATACGGHDERSALSSSTTGAPSSSTPVTTTATTAPPSTAAPAGARFVSTGPTNESRVALTFHTDGDLGLVDQLLQALAAGDARITSFVVGDWLEANPSYAQRLLDAGHELANHTFTHPDFRDLTPTAMLDEITRCRDTIDRLTGGKGVRLFRESGVADGSSTPPPQSLDAATRAGYEIVLGFDDDPHDYQDPGAAAVVDRALAAAKPGAILSLHFGHPGTVEAIPELLDGLTERGLEYGPATRLLGVS